MPGSLQEPTVRGVLERLHAAARADRARRAAQPQRPAPAPAPEGDRPLTAAERAKQHETHYMPISPEAGVLCYQLVRAARPGLVVEFGTSFGISTIYLAAAVQDNGSGRVLTTELSSAKVRAAGANLAEAGLSALVEVREGDARETLADLREPIAFLLIDGWKDLYLPVLRLLEPRLTPGALVLADDSTMASVADYLAYVREPRNGYESVEFPVGDGVEISCRLG